MSAMIVAALLRKWSVSPKRMKHRFALLARVKIRRRRFPLLLLWEKSAVVVRDQDAVVAAPLEVLLEQDKNQAGRAPVFLFNEGQGNFL
jgi:hypothetical protein